MELKELQGHIRTLASLEESDSPMISCYLDLSGGVNRCFEEIGARHQILTKSLSAVGATAIGELTYKIQDYVIGRIEPRTRGMAAFARTGRIRSGLRFNLRFPCRPGSPSVQRRTSIILWS